MKRFWMSWYCFDADHRPLTYPPNKEILGWWHTGDGLSGIDREYSIICSMVEAKNENEAWAAVLEDWPGVEKRFCEEQSKSEWRLSNRFVLSDWMIPRLKGTRKV